MSDQNKRLSFNEEARAGLLAGVTKLSKAVKATLGPRGRNVVIQKNASGSSIITKDGVTVAKSIQVKEPYENIGIQMVKEVALRTADLAGDGPQPLYSKVLTPTGFKEMGDLKVGDEICGTHGTTQTVLGIYPKGVREICEIKFANGRVVECCEDHLWNVTTNYGKNKTLTVREMINSGKIKQSQTNNCFKYGYFVPKSFADFPKNEVPLDPYFVGLLLGDGSLSGKNADIELSLGERKRHVIDKISLPKDSSMKVLECPSKNYIRVKLKGKSIKDSLESLGLLGVKSATKFIPKEYLYSDIKSRKALLEGLINTDGSINTRGLFEYSTISEQLFKDVQELCHGLAIPINCCIQSNRSGGYSNTPMFKITQLSGYKYGDKIIDIVKTGKFTEMQCIKVSNQNHLYFTNNYILTHNTTTATVLAEAILKEGLKLVAAGHDPMSLKRGIDKAVDLVTEQLKAQTKNVETPEDVKQIATISANGDQEIGNMISEAMTAVGKDGVITLEESKSSESRFIVSKGYEFDRGSVSPYFYTDQEKQRTVYENPLIWLANKKLAGKNVLDAMLPVLEHAANNGRPLVIIAQDFENDVIQALVVNHLRQVLKSVLIKAPGFGDRRKEMLGDISALTGAHLRDDEAYPDIFADLTAQEFGTAKRIEVYRDKTIIVAADDADEFIEARVSQIKNQLAQETDSWDRERTQQRLAKLVGGVGVIEVGGTTEIEMKEKKDRLEDALSATKAAVEEGMVPGGGVALVRASLALEKFDTGNDEENFGVKIVKMAIREPLLQICENAGEKGEVRIDQVLKETGAMGFDAYRCQMVDMFEAGIVDPKKVTRVALQNAASIAGLMLTTACVVAFEEDDKDQHKMSPNMMM